MVSKTRSSLSARASSRRRGFTLAEMLVVLVIIGMIAAIAVPMLSSTGDLDTSAAARALTSDLDYAQNYAITHQTRVRVMFDTANNTYTLMEDPESGSPIILTHPVNKKPYVIAYATSSGLKTVNLSTADFGGQASITYDSLGAPDSGGSVSVSVGSVTRQISVAAVTGKVTVN